MKPLIDFGRSPRLAFLALAAAGLCLAADARIARELANATGDAQVDVIVQYAQEPSDHDRDRLSRVGGALKWDLHSIHAEAVRVPAGAIATLASDPNVVYVSPDRPVRAMLDLSAAAVNAAAARSFDLDGTGIGVAVVDSGIAAHPDLGKRVVYSTSVLGGSATDGYGHGTHVAGIVGGSGKDSTGQIFTRTFKGIAPNVNLIDIRVLGSNGQGTDSSVIAGIEQAIQLKNRYNIRVINLSLGRPVFESYTVDPLCQAVEAAWNAGIVVVVAAGNDGRDDSMGTNGYGTITAPGNDPYVITVGAMKTNGTPQRGDDTIASYSSKGPTVIDHVVKPDLVAPGNQVCSLLDNGSYLDTTYPQNIVPFTYYTDTSIGLPTPMYYTLSGTSMATPVVSGAAALLIQQNPRLTPDQVKARLMKSAYKAFPASSTVIDPTTGIAYTDQYDIFTVGAGYLDIAAALNNNDTGRGLALSPTVAQAGNSGSYQLVFASGTIWGSGSPWALAVVWGTSVLQNASTNVNSDAVVWGTSNVQGLAVIWGTAVIWGSSPTSALNDGVLISGE